MQFSAINEKGVNDNKADENDYDREVDGTKKKSGFFFVKSFEDEKEKDYKNHIYINSPGALWDVFGFIEFNEMESPSSGLQQIKKTDPGLLLLCMAQQMKETDPKSVRQMIINDDLFKKELGKVVLASLVLDMHMF